MPSSGPLGFWRQTCGSFKRDECSLATQSMRQRSAAPGHLIRRNWVERAAPRVGILFCYDFLRFLLNWKATRLFFVRVILLQFFSCMPYAIYSFHNILNMCQEVACSEYCIVTLYGDTYSLIEIKASILVTRNANVYENVWYLGMLSNLFFHGHLE